MCPISAPPAPPLGPLTWDPRKLWLLGPHPTILCPQGLKGGLPRWKGQRGHLSSQRFVPSLNETFPCRCPKGYPPSRNEEQSPLFDWDQS